MTNKPEEATFLSREEKDWLANKLAGERKAKEAVRVYSMLESMWNPRVLLLALNYFGIVTASLGMLFFIPQIIKSLGNFPNMQVGWLTMIPYICGGIGLVLASFTDDLTLKVVAVSLASFGIFSALAVFWTLPTAYLSGAAAAAGIAWINSIGNLGGYFGPTVFGGLRDHFGSDFYGMLFLAALALLSVVLVFLLGHDRRMEQAGSHAAAE
jgi:nitrate/nitrite transporter NarK